MNQNNKIPNGWVIKKLSSIIESINAGVSVNSEDRKAKPGEFGVLKTSAVTNGIFNSDENKVIQNTELKKAKISPASDRIIVSRMNTPALVGANAYVPITKNNLFLPDRLWQLEPKKNQINMLWLSFVLGSPKYRSKLSSLATGTSDSMKNITKEDLKSLEILIPSLLEQQAIASLLSTWDEAIDKTEQLIHLKERQIYQLSKLLLFGRSRLGNKKNSLVKGQFFKYPSDWQLVNIGSISKEISIRNGQSEEKVLSCSKYHGFVNSLDYFGKQVFSHDTSNYKVVKKGQFGYPSNHIEEGSIGLLEHCEKGIVSPIYVVFETKKDMVYSPYLYKLLKTNVYRHIFQISTSSSVDRRGNLHWGDFSKIKIPLPALEEQKKITEPLSIIRHEINLLEQITEKYKIQKQGLMQKLLTGKWRIKHETIKDYVVM